MGYAGLNVEELARLLARRRIEAEPIEDDRWGDHCVVRLTDMRYPHARALLYYENMGIEPRLAKCVLGDVAREADEPVSGRIGALGDTDLAGCFELAGRRSEDPERLAGWIAEVFESVRTAADGN